MEFKDYYKVLGVDKDADTKAIKTAYRKLARQYHPDMNPDKGAEEKFKEVAEAYHVLKDEKLRAEFDELCEYNARSSRGFQPPPNRQSSYSGHQGGASFDGDYSEFFNSVFGARNQSYENSEKARQVKGQDVELELPIFLEETVNETKKEVEFMLPASNSNEKPSKKHLKVKIPLGVVDGEKIRLVGQGKPSLYGGPAGDLYLHIKIVPHPLFDVTDHNLSITLPLAPWEAALGAKITVPTLDGKVSLSIPPNTSSGKKLRVKGKGLKTKSTVGDLLVVVKIVMPATTTEKGKELWQELSASEHFDPRKEWGVNHD
ncbi:DnaJ C-terminal domain-containing protein [Gilvimarinus polysaccharolyticus]|uniref:DnaJ C-terminal domain-containing protein n=1 Tax=Gilvimarinus polysaccharolyticus TaxID=863921 RepID=UPI000673AA98|nr:DnaJ C-terminal domain-containing protein [Gilvimarinus polysaccharolyticus]